MTGRLRRLLATLAWCSISAGSVTAFAAVASIEIVIAGSDSDVERLRSSMIEAAQQAGVSPDVRRVAKVDPRDVLRRGRGITLWVDRSKPGRARLYLTSADAARVFVREFELSQELDSVAIELLYAVTRSSLTALVSGDHVGVPRAEFERTLTPPRTLEGHAGATEPVPSDKYQSAGGRQGGRAQRWEAGAFYEVAWLGPHAIEHGPGLDFRVRLGPLSLGAAGQWRLPVHVSHPELAATLSSSTLRALVAYPVRLSNRVDVALGGALGVDRIAVESRSRSPAVSASSSFVATDGVVRVQGALQYRFPYVLQLGALFGAEGALVGASYYVQRGAERERLFSPWRLRPFTSLSLAAVW